MNTHLLIIFAFVLAPIAYFAVQGIREREHATTLVRFLQYGEHLSPFSFFANLAASNSGLSASIYLIMVYGYLFGMGVLPWVVGFWMLTQGASSLVMQALERQHLAKGGFLNSRITLHEYLGTAYNSTNLRSLAAMLSIGCYLGLIACELLLGYEVTKALLIGVAGASMTLRMETLVITVTFAAVVFLYAALAGFRAVIRTEKLQLLLVVSMMIAIWYFIALHWNDIRTAYPAYFSVNPLGVLFNPTSQGTGSFLIFFVLMNIIFWGLWWPSAMDQWHRCAASTQSRVALDKHFGTFGFITSLYFLLLTATSLAAGATVRVLTSGDAGEMRVLQSLVSLIVHEGVSGTLLSACMAGLVCAGLAAAVVSTVDSYLVVILQSAVSDCLLARKGYHSIAETERAPQAAKLHIRSARRAVLPFFIATLTAMWCVSALSDVFTVIYASFSLMLASLPALIAALIGRAHSERRKAAVVSLSLGSIWAIATNGCLIWNIEKAIATNDAATLTLF